MKNEERVARLQQVLRESNLDCIVATFSAHVLMLSGYWPVIGTSVAVATRDGILALLVPEDEAHLTDDSWADTIATYQPGALDILRTPSQAASEPLKRLFAGLGLHMSRIGYEHGPVSEPSSYAAMYLFGRSILDLLAYAVPGATLVPCDDQLELLDSIKTPLEIVKIRTACSIAEEAFDRGLTSIRIGATEVDIANVLQSGLSSAALAKRAKRVGGFAFCMSGTDSERAFGAFAQTGRRVLGASDPVLVHCNSYADGYWTDITRSYVAGIETAWQREWRKAIFEARSAALGMLAPGVNAFEVDREVRKVFRSYHVDHLFKHSAGHGVGFAAISANARPRLHPQSPDVLEQGMVSNLEPALYEPGKGGMRHCDMVVITERGADVLTPFQSEGTVGLPRRSDAA